MKPFAEQIESLVAQGYGQADHGMKVPPPVAGIMDPAVAHQKSEMELLIGTWGDKRTTGEITDDIYAARTLGREVEL